MASKKNLIILMIILLLPCFVQAQDQDGHPYAAYRAFDQTENKGWRGLANDEHYLEAGQAIDEFIAENESLMQWQVRNLYFHGGQMFALADKSIVAVERFNKAIYADQPVDYPILWNAYIRATVAFLENDKAQLVEMRDKIENGPEFQGVTRNLDVVNKLLENYGSSYADAFLAK